MKFNIIKHYVDRTNKNLLIINSLIIASVLGLVAINYKDLYNVLMGPFPIDAATLIANAEKPADQRSQYFVTLKGDKSIYTGNSAVSVTKNSDGEEINRRITDNYMALVLGKRLIIVKTPEKDEKNEFTGILKNVSSLNVHSIDYTKEVINDIEKKLQAKNAFLPVMIDVYPDFKTVRYFYYGMLLVPLGIGFWNISRWYSRKRDDRKHPLNKKLTSFGDVNTITDEIDREAQRLCAEAQSKANILTITPSWILHPRTFSTDVVNLSNVVWIHIGEVERKSFFGKYSHIRVMLYSRDGGKADIGSNKIANTIMEGVMDQVPWIMTGHNAELDHLWNSNRQRFIAIVDQRKKEYHAKH